MATRIYENRLLELASSVLIPSLKKDEPSDDESMTSQADEDVMIRLSGVRLSLDAHGPTQLHEPIATCLRAQTGIAFPLDIYQEARTYFMESDKKTIRATPDYRGTGPWYDWVLVKYHVGANDIALYPFQTHGFIINNKREKKLFMNPSSQS
mmetsp:Transcript_118128/g.231939  ORF Transcript_118128/g.231939 Transcript_118128/m.231939 type:complete len:152 (+) Transcript_118128:191-646(+)